MVSGLIISRSKLVDSISTRGFRLISSELNPLASLGVRGISNDCSSGYLSRLVPNFASASWAAVVPTFQSRCIATLGNSGESVSQDTDPVSDIAPRIKFKRLDKTARNIMQILDKEAVEEVRGHREIPDIKPGYIIQLKLETPENKRRISTIKGIVIARRNAGLNTTIRLRRLITGIGVESLLPLYSPNIKEIKVLEKKKVRRAKLYYLRDRLNPLKNK